MRTNQITITTQTPLYRIWKVGNRIFLFIYYICYSTISCSSSWSPHIHYPGNNDQYRWETYPHKPQMLKMREIWRTLAGMLSRGTMWENGGGEGGKFKKIIVLQKWGEIRGRGGEDKDLIQNWIKQDIACWLCVNSRNASHIARTWCLGDIMQKRPFFFSQKKWNYLPSHKRRKEKNWKPLRSNQLDLPQNFLSLSKKWGESLTDIKKAIIRLGKRTEHGLTAFSDANHITTTWAKYVWLWTNKPTWLAIIVLRAPKACLLSSRSQENPTQLIFLVLNNP